MSPSTTDGGGAFDVTAAFDTDTTAFDPERHDAPSEYRLRVSPGGRR